MINPTKRFLLAADIALRRFVRSILYLPDSTPNTFFYIPLKAGGLGLLSYLQLIPTSIIKRLNSMSESSNAAVKKLLSEPFVKGLNERMMTISNGRNKDQYVIQNCMELFSSSTGAGLDQCVAPPSNLWLRDYNGTNRNYIEGVKLRLNVLPCRGSIANRTGPRNCRFGCERVESLSHILQTCPVTHGARIQRHDKIVDLLYDALLKKKEYTVLKEPHLTTNIGTRKPDLVVVSEKEVVVCDVAVPWETQRTLVEQYNTKVTTYSHPAVLEALQRRWPTKEISVEAFVISARGGYCIKNDNLLESLRLTKSLAPVACKRAWEGFLRTYKQFMRTVNF